jgi:hypothetical protein|tara:strand:- start:389 stop:1642 length:1254 start_codon:yes stop_codon:yes gene_type:complete
MKDLNQLDENLRDWFSKSKSKDGKPGWVQVVSGKPCARQPGQKSTPKCVSSAKRASMSKKERESAQRRKRKADPGQPEKSGAAKPTYVATDKKKKKKSKKNEEISMQLEQIIAEELEAVLNEKKKKKKKKSGKKDACYHKVKSRYKVWPSAYASGALVKCRKVGAKNWGKSKKESLQIMIEDELSQVLVETHTAKHEKELEKISDELAGASKMHKGQSDRIKKILDQTKDSEEDKVEEAVLLEKCWDGYKQVGMKKKGGKMVPNCVPLQEETELYEMKNCGCGQDPCVTHGEENKKIIIALDEVVGSFLEEALYYGLLDEEQELEEAKKKKACKPSKGKKFARRVKGRCVSYGQAGKAKGGGPRIKPGTGKGNAYCARSYGDMKSHGKDCSGKDRGTPLCLSRQKWKCSGKYSKKGK